MLLKELIKKQDKKLLKKYNPIRHKGVKGYTRGEWYLKKHEQCK